MTGQGEEDVVEGRPAAARCRRARCPPRPGGAAPRQRAAPSGAGTDTRSAPSAISVRISCGTRLPSAWIATATSADPADDLAVAAARALLELIGGALRDDGAAVDDDDVALSRSASSRYCVVSSTVMPCSLRVSTSAHTPWRLRGSSPVVGSSRNTTRAHDQSARDVDAPAHAAGIAADRALARVEQIELGEQILRPLLRGGAIQAHQTPEQLDVLSGPTASRRALRTGPSS